MKKNWSIILTSALVFVISILIIVIVKAKNEKEDNKNNVIATDTLVHVSKSETENEIIYEVIDNRKKMTYSWTFEKNEAMNKALKDNMEIELSLKLDILTNIENNLLDSHEVPEDKLVVAFEHHGELPTKAKVKIDVSDKYEDGKLLYLYYLNEEKDRIEYINNNIPVKNGKIEFEITHCSNYILTGSIVQDAVNNPKNVNLIIIVMVVVIIVLIGATLMQNKK